MLLSAAPMNQNFCPNRYGSFFVLVIHWFHEHKDIKPKFLLLITPYDSKSFFHLVNPLTHLDL